MTSDRNHIKSYDIHVKSYKNIKNDIEVKLDMGPGPGYGTVSLAIAPSDSVSVSFFYVSRVQAQTGLHAPGTCWDRGALGLFSI